MSVAAGPQYSCKMDAAASGGHFNVYTASVVYGGVGATEFGVTRSKLWNPFDSDMNGGEEKSKEFAEWLSSDVEIVKAYRQAIAGRLVICDCGFDWCPCAMLNFAMGHGMVSAKPEGLLKDLSGDLGSGEPWKSHVILSTLVNVLRDVLLPRQTTPELATEADSRAS